MGGEYTVFENKINYANMEFITIFAKYC